MQLHLSVQVQATYLIFSHQYIYNNLILELHFFFTFLKFDNEPKEPKEKKKDSFSILFLNLAHLMCVTASKMNSLKLLEKP